jgi:hypothetical protein
MTVPAQVRHNGYRSDLQVYLRVPAGTCGFIGQNVYIAEAGTVE